jgi:hypothetical protein
MLLTSTGARRAMWTASSAARSRRIGFAVSDIYPVALALLFAAGFLELTFNSMAQALVQLSAHKQIRGRTLGLFNMASLGLRAFSGITVG